MVEGSPPRPALGDHRVQGPRRPERTRRRGQRLNGAPGAMAYVALVTWVMISLAAFVVAHPRRAAIFTILGAMLFLPEGVAFKYPYLPYLDKHNIPYLCALLGLS